MIGDKKSFGDLLKFFVKEKKIVTIVIILAFLALTLLIYNFFDIIEKQKILIKRQLIKDYNSILNNKKNEIIKYLNRINNSIPSQFFNLLLSENYLKILYSYKLIHFAFILPDLKDFKEISNEEIQLEKTTKDYEKYNFSLKAFKNEKYDLSISLLMTLLKNRMKYRWLTIQIYKLMILNYQAINKFNLAKFYIKQALLFLYSKKIKTKDIFYFYDKLILFESDSNIKKSYFFEMAIIRSVFYPDYKIKSQFLFFSTLFFPKYWVYINSSKFLDKLNYLNRVYQDNLAFYDYIDINNFIFIKKIKIFYTDYNVFMSIDFLKFFNNEEKQNYYYFNIKVNDREFLPNKDGFVEYEKEPVPVMGYNNVYLVLYIEKSKLVEFLARKQYVLWITQYLILIFLIVISIIVITYYMIKEYNLNRLKSDFISIVSHELKTPITTIQLAVETLTNAGKNIPEEKKAKYFKKIFNETERLLYLINNLLAFSRNERGKVYYNFQIVNIVDLIKDVVDFFSLTRKNINFILDFSENKINILIDKGAFKQIIYNILDNSFKYSGEEKIVQINVYRKKEKVYLEFIDNGYGMDAEELKFIYHKFYRGKETQNIPGTGLGLTLIKNIVDAHNGKIEIHSKKGEGTKITIILHTLKEDMNDKKENLDH